MIVHGHDTMYTQHDITHDDRLCTSPSMHKNNMAALVGNIVSRAPLPCLSRPSSYVEDISGNERKSLYTYYQLPRDMVQAWDRILDLGINAQRFHSRQPK